MYERRYRGERILVICSFRHRAMSYRLPEGYRSTAGTLLLDNYPGDFVIGKLRPYEVQILRFEN